MTAEDALELDVMAHRYLYCVLHRPVITDQEYDKLEKCAVALLPKGSPVHRPGSDKSTDYSWEDAERATAMLVGL